MRVMGAGVVVAMMMTGACKPGDSCAKRCHDDRACQQAFIDEGKVPGAAGPAFDTSFCNGLCSALKNELRSGDKLAKDLGVAAAPATHPCMPAPAQK